MRKLVSLAVVVIPLVAVLSIPPAASAQSEGDLRLADGSGPHEGRVEVFHDGQWGTVCDDNPEKWFGENADVVCRQLGFEGAKEGLLGAAFGEGSDPIWMDEVNCAGNESRLVDCPFNGFGVHNCAHSEDVGVICIAVTSAPAMSIATLIILVIALCAWGAVVLRGRKQTA